MTKDILLFDEQLSSEDLAIHKYARDYCKSELMQRMLETNRHKIFSKEI